MSAEDFVLYEGAQARHTGSSCRPASRPRRSSINRPPSPPAWHPVFSRRTALQAGAISLLGLGINHLAPLRALAGPVASAIGLSTTLWIGAAWIVFTTLVVCSVPAVRDFRMRDEPGVAVAAPA